MRFDEFNKNDKGEKLDEILPAVAAGGAAIGALARGAAKAAAPIVRKGAQELIKRGKPVVQDLIKKGKDAFKRDPKGKNLPPNVGTAPKQPGSPKQSPLGSPTSPKGTVAPKTQQPPTLQTPKQGTAPKIRTQPPGQAPSVS